MTVGQRLTMPLVIQGTNYGPAQAEVVAVHPQGRHYTVRYNLPGGSFNETFILDRRGNGEERTEHEDDRDHE